jgi:hemerythrin
MEEVIWTDDLSTGDEIVDFQHKKLFGYLNILILVFNTNQPQPVIIKNTMDALVEYTMIHFEDEEIVLENIGYPDIVLHQKWHKEFATKILDLQQRLKAGENIIPELVTLIKIWFIAHVKSEDMKAMKYKTD